MNLSDKIQAQRAARLQIVMRYDHVHGRSTFTEIEFDGCDAARLGYPITSCPYANTSALDLSGRPVPITEEQFAKAASWRRGWMLKTLAQTCPGKPATLVAFWQALNICLDARGIAAATFSEARDFWEYGERNAEKVAAFWSADNVAFIDA